MNPKLMMIVCVLSCVAQAAPRRMVVASGECKDLELSTHAKAFHDALKARQEPESVLSSAAFSERRARWIEVACGRLSALQSGETSL